jgi:SM-20-related protein
METSKYSIDIIDDFFQNDMYDDLLSFLHSAPMHYGSKSHDDTDPHGHWVTVFSGADRYNKEDITENLPYQLRLVWSQVQSIMHDKQLISCYMNGHTYGTEGYFHRDFNEDGRSTAVVYLVKDQWIPDHGGETVFLDDDTKEIKASILPKRNRVVIFPSRLYHCARGVTRKFNGIRRTLMFKTKT